MSPLWNERADWASSLALAAKVASASFLGLIGNGLRTQQEPKGSR